MKYRSEIYEVIHQSAADKFEIGAISEAKMREYDKMCLIKENLETVQKPENSEERKNADLAAAV